MSAVYISHRFSVTQESIDLYSSLDSDNPDKDKWHFKLRLHVLLPLFIVIFGAIAWPVCIYWKTEEFFQKRRTVTTIFAEDVGMKVTKENLIERQTLADIEARESVIDPLNSAPAKSFGHLNSVWENFILKAEDEDELWTFEVTVDMGWSVKNDCKGYAILRGNNVIEHMMTSWYERVSDQQE